MHQPLAKGEVDTGVGILRPVLIPEIFTTFA